MGTCPGKANWVTAGVRSPPLPGGPRGSRWPRGTRAVDDAKGGSLGWTHSVRPRDTAERMPRHAIRTHALKMTWWPSGICPGEANAPLVCNLFGYGFGGYSWLVNCDSGRLRIKERGREAEAVASALAPEAKADVNGAGAVRPSRATEDDRESFRSGGRP